MKQGWEIKKLGEVFTLKAGKSISSDNIQSDGGEKMYPCFGGNGIRGYVDTYIAEGAYPIIGRVGALCGNIQLSQGKFYATEHAIVAYIKSNNIKAEWAALALKSLNLRQYAKGVAQPVISAGQLAELSIPVPPREEQERIVAELDCLSGVIEKKREQLRELDALAQSIFYQMFGDPITNEKGWQVKKLGEVCDIINGFAFKSNLFRKGGDAILRISNIQNGYVDLTDAVYFDKSDYEKVNFEKYAVKPYDIVIALSGATTGKLGINTTGKDLYLNQRVAICREKNNDITRLFLLYYLHDQSLKFLEDAAGVAQPNLSTEQMKEYSIGIPPLTLQQEFADKIEAIEKQKELIKQSITQTEELFNSRMDYYFN